MRLLWGPKVIIYDAPKNPQIDNMEGEYSANNTFANDLGWKSALLG